MSKNVEICMADILSQLLDECPSVPEQVLELLLANFNTKAIVSGFPFHAAPGSLAHERCFIIAQKSNPAAHQLAIEVCKATETRLQKYVAQVST